MHWTVSCADAADFLAQLAPASVDLLLTDPPYNLGAYSTGNIAVGWRADFNNDVAAWDQGFRPGDWLAPFRRVLKPTGTVFAFCSYNTLGAWHTAFDPAFDTFQMLVWHKTNPPPKLRRAGFLNACELVACAWDRGHTWNFSTQREMHNHIEAPICMGRERLRDPFHPTQKPVRVLSRLIELASHPGDLVVDPFMGVGSTGEAALRLGRRFAGCDLEPAYVDAARARLAGVVRAGSSRTPA